MKSHWSDNLTEMLPKTFTKISSITLSATVCGRQNTPDQIAFQTMAAQNCENLKRKEDFFPLSFRFLNWNRYRKSEEIGLSNVVLNNITYVGLKLSQQIHEILWNYRLNSLTGCPCCIFTDLDDGWQTISTHHLQRIILTKHL